MTDVILNALNSSQLNNENISFSAIRRIAGIDYDIWNELGRGRAILTSVEQLDQYLYSYGPMIKSQWDFVLDILDDPNCSVQLSDYACGQGLASVFFHDKFRNSELTIVENINLIEPSFIALKRAIGILQCCYPNARVSGANKLLDEVLEEEIVLSAESLKVHLFSNILDVEGFDQRTLFNKVFSIAGRHWIIAVSHDRDHNGGSARVRDTYFSLLDDELDGRYTVTECDMQNFNCQRGQRAIAFIIKLEI